ncbi:hypothetical protein H2198_002443 [Neophaeococcomyces mojaviensis]|uniref:Uncharacterized protein n=1 Tax=Neophaeococcomyces mojaviensis TaxID=3383035 RepID=A0ACC3AEF0_9EURO|nr:hypothetical protein H2198_002443 [Knufia sp. JES_112]
MKVQCLSCAPVLLAASGVHASVNATPQALNTSNVASIPNPGGPIHYYNATGDTPSYQLNSPDPVAITPLNSTSAVADAFYQELFGIANGTYFANNCSQCVAGAEVLHLAAITQPVSTFVQLLIRICEAVPAVQSSLYATSCAAAFGNTPSTSDPYSNGAAGLGAYYAQLFAKMSISTGDFNTYCYNVWNVCPAPAVVGIDESLYFSPKPASANTVPVPSGKNINALHLSDWHIDPRYDVGSESNCTDHLCCRPYSTNKYLHTNANNASVPASRFGSFICDSPADLALSSFQSMPSFFNMNNLSFSIFTGDIVSHDNDDQLSQAYVEYEEQITYQTFKAHLGNIPVYATLGNHDSFPEALNTQNGLNPGSSTSANAMSWNYQLLSSLWQNNSWIDATEAQYAATHYAAYAHTTAQGLRIISINTDFWYKANIFNYWNSTNPDTSGILKFLADELTACEARGQKAWIIGHVLSGYDGTNPLPNPTALFYSIVARFSPSTIAGIFFGHTHQQQFQIFYDFLPNSTYVRNGRTYRNTTMVDYSKPIQMAFIGPSIVPLTNLNAGYALYQVDSTTFQITGLQTYFANISQSLSWTTPVWQFEYDARTVYGSAATNQSGSAWPANAPLNATFWHGVTETMLKNSTLVQQYSLFETKSSVLTKNCTSAACARQKVCYIRSGSAALGRACPSS